MMTSIGNCASGRSCVISVFVDVPIGYTLLADAKSNPLGLVSAFWHVPLVEATLMGFFMYGVIKNENRIYPDQHYGSEYRPSGGADAGVGSRSGVY